MRIQWTYTATGEGKPGSSLIPLMLKPTVTLLPLLGLLCGYTDQAQGSQCSWYGWRNQKELADLGAGFSQNALSCSGKKITVDL